MHPFEYSIGEIPILTEHGGDLVQPSRRPQLGVPVGQAVVAHPAGGLEGNVHNLLLL